MNTPAFLKRAADSTTLRLVLAIYAGWLLHGFFAPDLEHDHPADQAGIDASADAVAYWTCSMDPQVRATEPGLCPICGMELIAAAAGGDDLGPRQLRLSEAAVALAEIRTAPVERRSVGRELRLAGRIEPDQTRIAVVSNWMPGRLERLFVTSTGVQIRAGDHLAELYNPELLLAAQELLDADAARRRLDEGSPGSRSSIVEARLARAKQALLELGLTQQEVIEVLFTGKPHERLTMYSPLKGVVTEKRVLEGEYVEVGTHLYTISDLSKVWAVVDAYETDLAWLRFGQLVRFDVLAYPGREFVGRVSSIDPVLDPRTRTARVRVNVENEDLALMPGMFVRARVMSTLTAGGRPVDPSLEGRWMCPMHPEVVADEGETCPDCGMDLVPVADLGFAVGGDEDPPLLIPASAALVTGRRAVVYVRLPDQEDKDPVFEGREVTLGPRAGDAYVVMDGLAEGELVVVSGAFRVDSELQLQAKRSMMSAGDPQPESDRIEVPRALRQQLGDVIVEAVGVATALAGDDLATAQGAANGVHMALMQVDTSPLGLADGRRAKDLIGDVMRAARNVDEATTIEAARVEFEHLQTALLAMAGALGYETGDGRTVSVFHCPMAFDNRGADWLQWTGTRTENPYFGSSMFRCGSEQALVATGTED